MRNRSQLVSPQKAKYLNEDVGSGYFGVLGADDEDDELEDQEGSDDGQSSHPSLEELLFETDAEFSEEEKLEEAPAGQAEGAEADRGAHRQGVAERAQARAIARPISLTKRQLEEHYMTGHAKYSAGCEYCLRCRGRADKHMSGKKDLKDYLDGEDEIPMCSMDFCFLAHRNLEGSGAEWSRATDSHM